MESTKDIKNVKNKITNTTLENATNRISSIIKLIDPPQFISCYIAGDKNFYESATNYIQKILGVDEKSVFTYEFFQDKDSDQEVNLTLPGYIRKNLKKLQKPDSETILIKSLGIERLIGQVLDYQLYRNPAIHNWDQNLIEKPKQYFPGLNKKVVVLNHLGKSLGEKVYEYSVNSALISQFKSLVFEQS